MATGLIYYAVFLAGAMVGFWVATLLAMQRVDNYEEKILELRSQLRVQEWIRPDR